MGTYGLLAIQSRSLPRDGPRSSHQLIIISAIIGIIYGALVAMVQPDVKRLVAYSSVSHMGFVVLGLVLVHRTGNAGRALPDAESRCLNRRTVPVCRLHLRTRHTRMISEFGGLATPMPWFSTLFVIASLSSIGLAVPERIRRRVSDHDRNVDVAGSNVIPGSQRCSPAPE